MKLILEFTPPPRASMEEVEEFIITELSFGEGNRHPNDPLFHSLSGVKIIHPPQF